MLSPDKEFLLREIKKLRENFNKQFPEESILKLADEMYNLGCDSSYDVGYEDGYRSAESDAYCEQVTKDEAYTRGWDDAKRDGNMQLLLTFENEVELAKKRILEASEKL